MNACIHLHPTPAHAHTQTHTHTYTLAHTPHLIPFPSMAGSSTVPIKSFMGNVDIFKYESENIYGIAMFNFQIFVILRLLVPVSNDQNKD